MNKISAKLTTQISVAVDNVPGMLARVAKAFEAEGVGVEGICRTTPEFGNVITERFIVNDIHLAKQVLTAIGKRYTEEEIIAIDSLNNHSGTLATVAKKFGDAGINLENFYYSCTGKSDKTTMYVAVSGQNIPKAMHILANL